MVREHNIIVREYNYSGEGTQCFLSGNKIIIVREQNSSCQGAQFIVSEYNIIVRRHNNYCEETQEFL